MCKNHVINHLLLVLMLIGTLQSTAFASCESLNLYVINQSSAPISLLGDKTSKPIDIAAYSQGQYLITPGNFYTQSCRSIYLIQNTNDKPQLGLVDHQAQISVRINQNGQVESNLAYNFSVEKLIQYEGLGPFLS